MVELFPQQNIFSSLSYSDYCFWQLVGWVGEDTQASQTQNLSQKEERVACSLSFQPNQIVAFVTVIDVVALVIIIVVRVVADVESFFLFLL